MPLSYMHAIIIKELYQNDGGVVGQKNGNFGIRVTSLTLDDIKTIALNGLPLPPANIGNVDLPDDGAPELVAADAFLARHIAAGYWKESLVNYQENFVLNSDGSKRDDIQLDHDRNTYLFTLGGIARRLMELSLLVQPVAQQVDFGVGAVDVTKQVLLDRGFTEAEFIEGLSQIADADRNAVNIAALKTAGFTAEDLIKAGYTYAQLTNNGANNAGTYTDAELITALGVIAAMPQDPARDGRMVALLRDMLASYALPADAVEFTATVAAIKAAANPRLTVLTIEAGYTYAQLTHDGANDANTYTDAELITALGVIAALPQDPARDGRMVVLLRDMLASYNAVPVPAKAVQLTVTVAAIKAAASPRLTVLTIEAGYTYAQLTHDGANDANTYTDAELITALGAITAMPQDPARDGRMIALLRGMLASYALPGDAAQLTATVAAIKAAANPRLTTLAIAAGYTYAELTNHGAHDNGTYTNDELATALGALSQLPAYNVQVDTMLTALHGAGYTTKANVQRLTDCGFTPSRLEGAGYNPEQIFSGQRESIFAQPHGDARDRRIAHLIQHQGLAKSSLLFMLTPRYSEEEVVNYIRLILEALHRTGVAAQVGMAAVRYNTANDVYSLLKRGFTQEDLEAGGYTAAEIQAGLKEYLKKEIVVEDAANPLVAANAIVNKNTSRDHLRELGFADDDANLRAALRSLWSQVDINNPVRRSMLLQNQNFYTQALNLDGIAHHDVRYFIKAGFTEKELKKAGFSDVDIQAGIFSYIDRDIMCRDPLNRSGSGTILKNLGYSEHNTVIALGQYRDRRVDYPNADEAIILAQFGFSEKYLKEAHYTEAEARDATAKAIKIGKGGYVRLQEEDETQDEILAVANAIDGNKTKDVAKNAKLLAEALWPEAVGVLPLEKPGVEPPVVPVVGPLPHVHQPIAAHAAHVGAQHIQYLGGQQALRDTIRGVAREDGWVGGAVLHSGYDMADPVEKWLVDEDEKVFNAVRAKRDSVVADIEKWESRNKWFYAGCIIGGILLGIAAFAAACAIVAACPYFIPVSTLLIAGIAGGVMVTPAWLGPISIKIHIWRSKKAAAKEFNEKLKNGAFVRDISILRNRSQNFVRKRAGDPPATFGAESGAPTDAIKILYKTWCSSNRQYAFDHIMQRFVGVPRDGSTPAVNGNPDDARRLLCLLINHAENWNTAELTRFLTDKNLQEKVIGQLLANVNEGRAGTTVIGGLAADTRPFSRAMALVVLGRTMKGIMTVAEVPLQQRPVRQDAFVKMLATQDSQKLLKLIARDTNVLQQVLGEVWDVRGIAPGAAAVATGQEKRTACFEAIKPLLLGLALNDSKENRAAITNVIATYNNFLAAKGLVGGAEEIRRWLNVGHVSDAADGFLPQHKESKARATLLKALTEDPTLQIGKMDADQKSSFYYEQLTGLYVGCAVQPADAVIQNGNFKNVVKKILEDEKRVSTEHGEIQVDGGNVNIQRQNALTKIARARQVMPIVGRWLRAFYEQRAFQANYANPTWNVQDQDIIKSMLVGYAQYVSFQGGVALAIPGNDVAFTTLTNALLQGLRLSERIKPQGNTFYNESDAQYQTRVVNAINGIITNSTTANLPGLGAIESLQLLFQAQSSPQDKRKLAVKIITALVQSMGGAPAFDWAGNFDVYAGGLDAKREAIKKIHLVLCAYLRSTGLYSDAAIKAWLLKFENLFHDHGMNAALPMGLDHAAVAVPPAANTLIRTDIKTALTEIFTGVKSLIGGNTMDTNVAYVNLYHVSSAFWNGMLGGDAFPLEGPGQRADAAPAANILAFH